MHGSFSGLEITTSDLAADVKVFFRWRGIADKRRPNTKRPFYRKVRIVNVTPLIYRVGNKIICHPSLLSQVQAAAQQGMQADVSRGPSLVEEFAPYLEYFAKHLR